MLESTTRAYTLKLLGDGDWREALWRTHVAVNRGAQVWGDWLLTLRGGLPASLADSHKERRPLLALSWLSVESPASLAPQDHIVARGTDTLEERRRKVMERFSKILDRLKVAEPVAWKDACERALTARIRDDAVWVDRSQCFCDLQSRFPGLTSDWAKDTLLGFLGDEKNYFQLPQDNDKDKDKAGAVAAAESKDFVQKAEGWLSCNWGSGDKSDPHAISNRLLKLAATDPKKIIGKSGTNAIKVLVAELAPSSEPTQTRDDLLGQIKQAIGWKGRPSKGAMALERLYEAETISPELWQRTAEKLKEESAEKRTKVGTSAPRTDWMPAWRAWMESRLGMPFRVDRDYTWEHGVMLDHALRRVSGAHSWVKLAESERQRFQVDAQKLDGVPTAARQWLDTYCEERARDSGAIGEYLIRKRAIDGWDKVVSAWAALGPKATRLQRIEAARDLQTNLDENEKFGDIQLFAGAGDEEEAHPRPCLADDDAICVWQTPDGRAEAEILKNYVAATVARHNQARFKVPAFRHPDPLRNPIYVDYGNSRWGISYSALKSTQDRRKLEEKLTTAKTESTRTKIRQQLESSPELRGVTLDVWNGSTIETLSFRWQGKRLWRDLDLAHFGQPGSGAALTRADRLGRIAADQQPGTPASIANVFDLKDWNGRLQVPRTQLDRLADVVYGKENGKRSDPDYGKFERALDDPKARRQWERLRWFLTTSAKLQPQGPWLDYSAGLPEGIDFKKSRKGNYLEYAANKGRKGAARIQLARLPGLRILSLDLGHRYAAACTVWETLTNERLIEACRAAGHPPPTGNELYIHLQRRTKKMQKSGRNKGQPVVETTVYRRLAADTLPDGHPHPAPWARLVRQFLIKLQGEDRPARRALDVEISGVNSFRKFLGLEPLAEVPRIDDLQRDTVRLARLGLRRLNDMARIAYAMTATKKPVTGGRVADLTEQQRIEYLLDALLLWQDLASSNRYRDDWANEQWRKWIVDSLEGPEPATADDTAPRAQRRKLVHQSRASLKPVAEKLVDPQSDIAVEISRLWATEWQRRQDAWRKYLRWLRRFVLPRKKDSEGNPARLRGLGGLSVQRLQTIRALYQALKAFSMRPEPTDLRKNVPQAGDDSLAKFGHRILEYLERRREQRTKQLASRVIEAGLGAGRMKRVKGRDRKRPRQRIDAPCHAIVVENLERYKPEESRLRRENRQLMNWAARKVRRYIMEGCELHGLYFLEVSPTYTSRQDSRTGAPGIRCEDVDRKVLEEAVRRVDNPPRSEPVDSPRETRFEREVTRWVREVRRIREADEQERNARDRVLAAALRSLENLPSSRSTIRLPRVGGEIFVSSAPGSSALSSLQADLNAAANIGLKALLDPDWEGAWWFVLVDSATGSPAREKVQGSAVWNNDLPLFSSDASSDKAPKKRRSKTKSRFYAFNPKFSPAGSTSNSWLATKPYWRAVEDAIAERLAREQSAEDNPF